MVLSSIPRISFLWTLFSGSSSLSPSAEKAIKLTVVEASKLGKSEEIKSCNSERGNPKS